MTATQSQESHTRSLIDAALEGRLTDSQAEELSALGPEVAKLALILAARCIAELRGKLALARPASPSTPSGQRPVYTKPSAPRRKGKPGARPGHPGHHRPKPTRIDRQEDHRLDRCPSCGGALQRCGQTRRRIIEDLLQDLHAEAVEHTIHRDYCPACHKHVEPVVPDALPSAEVGHRVVGLTAWLHYGLGLTISQTQELLRYQLQTGLSPGGLSAAWGKMATILTPWYEQIASEARGSAVLHADETGWRVNGITHWLWCFANPTTCYYLIDRSRGTPALEKFFTDAFDGVLVFDFWAPYDKVLTDDRQCCLAHLLRELEKVDLINTSPVWKAFAKQLRRLVRDGIRLRKRADFTPAKYHSRLTRINLRVYALAHGRYSDPDATRLAGRLSKHCDQLFTFLDRPEVPYDNNLAERMIRPAVILRKTCQGNRSEQGAAVQAVLMSVYRTLKLRGRDPLHTIVSALTTYLITGQLPPLPVQSVPDG